MKHILRQAACQVRQETQPNRQQQIRNMHEYLLAMQFVTCDGPNGTELAGVDWGFDAYGGLNDEHDLDDKIAACICKQAGVQAIDGPMVLEAGSIHVDGEG